VTLYTAMDPDKAEKMMAPWQQDGPYYMCLGYDGNMLMDKLALNFGMSANLSFLAFVVIMIVYALFCTTDFEHEADKVAWWYWVKFSVVGCFGLLIVSIVQLFAGLQAYTLMVYPNTYAADHCGELGQAMMWQNTNMWGTSQLTTFLEMTLVGGPMLAVCSYGVACKAASRDKRNKVLDAICKQDKRRKSKQLEQRRRSSGGFMMAEQAQAMAQAQAQAQAAKAFQQRHTQEIQMHQQQQLSGGLTMESLYSGAQVPVAPLPRASMSGVNPMQQRTSFSGGSGGRL